MYLTPSCEFFHEQMQKKSSLYFCVEVKCVSLASSYRTVEVKLPILVTVKYYPHEEQPVEQHGAVD